MTDRDAPSNSTRRFGVGVLGLGVMGQRMVEGLRAHPRFDVMAACDPAVNAGASTVTMLASPEAVIAHPGVDCVYIATPPLAHLALLQQAVAARKAVFCEKPLATSVSEAQACVAAAEAAGVPAAVNFPFARAEASLRLQQLVRSGALGVVQEARLTLRFATWPRGWQASATTWLARPVQGGFAREVLSHFLFLSLRLFGQGTIREATLQRGPAGTETALQAVIDFGAVPLTIDAAVAGEVDDHNRYEVTGSRDSAALFDWSRLEHGGVSSERSLSMPAQVQALYRLLCGEPDHGLATVHEAAEVVNLVEGLLAR
jgi:predicted dehydrogenase